MIILLSARGIFLASNIILLYIFLTPRRSRMFQIGTFTVTFAIVFGIHLFINPFNPDPLLKGYILGCLYLVPAILIFRETLQAKLFVFFMNFSLSQLTFLIFMHIDSFISPPVPYILVLAGLIIELATIPLIKHQLKRPVRDIIGIINQHTPLFTLFPVISFILLAAHAYQRQHTAESFVILLLTTALIFLTYCMTSIAISSTKRQQELELISKTDLLTGLYNRRHMEEKVGQELKANETNSSEFTLVTADIDHFKKINDTHGHDCGDLILKEISANIQRSLRANDSVARWGGEEFMILLPGIGSDQARILAERIRKRVESQVYTHYDHQLHVTLTMGIASVKTDDTILSLAKRADLALYHGKQTGRNCVIGFDEICHTEAMEIDKSLA